ncbi:YlmC/YmxH family sporulation protein [Clostridium sediminicola]|uniref:YlmC/YmxH family sporulation protein n=1 Tax=Clostridium sediminicola TaxID=3114879 RepID=UPI0031F1F8CA
MDENTKYYSEMERFEIININDGEKYNYLMNNDIIIDDDGYLRLLIIDNNSSKFRFFSGNDFFELPWEFVKKIGSSTIIVDVEENEMRRISR